MLLEPRYSNNPVKQEMNQRTEKMLNSFMDQIELEEERERQKLKRLLVLLRAGLWSPDL